jgi:hypothetical protein
MGINRTANPKVVASQASATAGESASGSRTVDAALFLAALACPKRPPLARSEIHPPVPIPSNSGELNRPAKRRRHYGLIRVCGPFARWGWK